MPLGSGVSVLVPTRNRWHFVEDALASVQRQTVPAREIFVVDDGSTTPSPTGLRQVPRVTMIRHEVNRGVSAARNTGIERATGDWIAFLDDDDIWAPHKLERQLAAADATGADLVTCTTFGLSPDGRATRSIAVSGDELERALLRRNVIGGPSTVMVRTEVLRRSGGFDERLSVIADWELWFRLARHCRATAVPEPLVAVRRHGSNMQLVDIEQVTAELRLMATIHADRLAGLGAGFGSPELSEWLARTQRRAGLSLSAARTYARTARRAHPVHNGLRAAACVVEAVARRQLPPVPRGTLEPPAWARVDDSARS
jgi:glycosyltransferase involved in cell wall biosynthesis